MLTLYGIKNCDTIKKARTWLESHNIPYQFHDYRIDGMDESLLRSLENKLGWQTMLNKRSTSWRQLSDAQKSDLNQEKALQLMLQIPNLIKRPIAENDTQVLIGFTPQQYQQFL